jgi:hypothetical protein
MHRFWTRPASGYARPRTAQSPVGMHLRTLRSGSPARDAVHTAGDPVPVEIGSENVRPYRRTHGRPEMLTGATTKRADNLTEVPRPTARSKE